MKFILSLLFSVLLCYSDYILVVGEPVYGDVSVINDTSLSYSAPTTDVILLDSFSIQAVNTNTSEPIYQYILIIPYDNPEIYTFHDLEYSLFFDEPVSYYPTGNGEIFIVIAMSGKILDNSWGIIKIYDAVANIITNDIAMKIAMTSNGQWVLYGIWDKKNLNGRYVASSAYVAVVKAHIFMNDKVDYGIWTKKMLKVQE